MYVDVRTDIYPWIAFGVGIFTILLTSILDKRFVLAALFAIVLYWSSVALALTFLPDCSCHETPLIYL